MRLKRLIAAAAAAVIAASGIFSGAAAGAESGQTNALVILGDSIAAGFGLKGYNGTADSSGYSFGNILAGGCTSKKNFAADARTTAGLLDSLSDKEVKSAIKKADSIVISIGGNDLLQPFLKVMRELSEDKAALLKLMRDKSAVDKLTEKVEKAVNGVNLKDSRKNITSILKKIKKLNADCDLYILTVYDPFEGGALMARLDGIAGDKINTLNKYIRSSAKKYGARVVDIYSAFSGKAQRYTNILRMDIHPNKAGHSVIADRIKKAGFKTAEKDGDERKKAA